MKQPNDFKHWIRRQIEDNPQEPPEAAWDQISESLDLETAWQGINQDLELDNLWSSIDNRLQVHDQLLWWERASGLMATAVVTLLVLIPVLWQPQYLGSELAIVKEDTSAVADHAIIGFGSKNVDKEANTATTITENKPDHAPVASKIQADEKQTIQEVISKSHTAATTSKRNASGMGNGTKPTMHEPAAIASVDPYDKVVQISDVSSSPTGPAEALETEQHIRSQQRLTSLAPQEGLTEPHPLQKIKIVSLADEKEEEEGVIMARAASPFSAWRLGVGASARVSWLLSQKTYDAMEKSSLTTSKPAFHSSLSIMAEKHLSPRLAVYGDLALLSGTGQRYEEYLEGVYGTTNTQLRYSHLSLLLSYNPKGASAFSRAHVRWLAGLTGGWLHSANLNGPSGERMLTEEYQKFTSGFMIGYEYNLPLSKRLWMSYGLRGYVDLFNIYAGTDQIPADFRPTKNTFLDFNIGLKYEFRKM